MIKRNIGGDRLGSGNKMNVDLHNFERSTHDLGYIWRSTQACGTLVPFMSELALSGDTFDINLECNIMTHPTIGPLFGSYKIQLDVFCIPLRLYNSWLHNNKLDIGLKMNQVQIPQMELHVPNVDLTTEAKRRNIDNQQINPSALLSYLNIRGCGRNPNAVQDVRRVFNAVPYLGYWDIYKNYYANKQEQIGAYIHADYNINKTITDMEVISSAGNVFLTHLGYGDQAELIADSTLMMQYSGGPRPLGTSVLIDVMNPDTRERKWVRVSDIWTEVIETLNISEYKDMNLYYEKWVAKEWAYADEVPAGTDIEPQVVTFPLTNIDEMREDLLKTAGNISYIVTEADVAPYGPPLKYETTKVRPLSQSQEGLGIKTYQSDLLNSWMETEWIDGANGINAITSIDTSSGSFEIQTLVLARKVYDMLNRIAISGGTYRDWMEVNWGRTYSGMIDSPVYLGGLIRELTFDEVISNSQTTDQPLGTLGGRGVMTNKKKGGRVNANVDEPSYIMGIISLTPRLDYSQGNKWDTGLRTMDDLHKPMLDEIGFQDDITDQRAWWDTICNNAGVIQYASAGKLPAWINYMTNVNQTRGNFAIKDNEMFMTLNRNYEVDATSGHIKDLTTYIDPVKYNQIFAETRRDAQNFWTQIKVDITARRKMSAKIMPNL